METSAASVPLDQLVNVVALAQSLIFAAFFMARPQRADLSTWFLTAAFLILASVKADELYQMLGGFQRYPEYGFVLSPIQAAMTPTLYLFVAARTDPTYRLRPRQLWHLTPAVLMTLYLAAIYYRLDVADKITLIETGGLNTAVNRIVVPLAGDAVQLAYLGAAYRRLSRYDLTLKNWFARVEDRNLVWLRRLLTLWAAVFVLHAALTLAGALLGAHRVSYAIMGALDFAHLGIVNLLALFGAADAERRLIDKAAVAPQQKYAGSSLTPAARAALFRRAEAALLEDRLYLKPDLTVGDLAGAVAAAPREVSEAINGAGGQTFFDLVNQARIAHAQRQLVTSPALRVLDIAFQSGFNSKSAFNEAFKKHLGVTPTQYRRARTSSPKEAPSGANPGAPAS